MASEEEFIEFKHVPAWEVDELVGPTGAWLGRAGAELHHHDPGLAAALAAFLNFEKPRRVIDMGCGLGDYVKAIRARGIECDGFDGHADTAELTGGLCYTADFADSALPDRIAGVGYDWCLCLEVFEHVPEELEAQLVRCMLAGAGRGLIVSVATPGQGGLGHVNERPHEYVVKLLEEKGLLLDVSTMVKLRKYCRLPWFQMNTLVFRRREIFMELMAQAKARAEAQQQAQQRAAEDSVGQQPGAENGDAQGKEAPQPCGEETEVARGPSGKLPAELGDLVSSEQGGGERRH